MDSETKEDDLVLCLPPTKKNKLPLYEELDAAIKKAIEARSIVPNFKNFTLPEKLLLKMIKQELNLFDNGGLLLIKPTSVQSERASFACGYLCRKIRSRMNDDTLDHLCFLRSFFQRDN